MAHVIFTVGVFAGSVLFGRLALGRDFSPRADRILAGAVAVSLFGLGCAQVIHLAGAVVR